MSNFRFGNVTSNIEGNIPVNIGNLLPPLIFFKQNKSTTSAAQQVIDCVLTGLDSRKQTVEVTIGGRKLRSEAGEVTIGIPQGSALGNTMFLVFIKDLASYVSEGSVTLFADDTSVITCARSYKELDLKIKSICSQLQEWFSVNGLVLNITKSNVMLFCGKSVPVPVDVVPPMPTCKHLQTLSTYPSANSQPIVSIFGTVTLLD
ncbi:reverse transcriptase (RNA-dependent DNA polymerase) domain-containing protein [Phthorimaea operculella]|nr:reverse transcriptase (RNA-dependent DNA polymerase) domain-containing protein [Phthorimaea operculella]